MTTRRSLETSLDGRRPTIHDVAQRAGVSHQTVSRFLSRPEGLKLATREKVQAAVKDLDYRPSAIARSMRTKQAKNILIVLPALSTYIPFEILKGASDEADALGYSVEILVLESKSDAQERLRALGSSGQVDGILVLSQIPGVAGDSNRNRWGAPLVVLGEYDAEMHAVGVLADASPVVDVVRLLVDAGHRNILHVAGPADWPSARNRRAVFERTVADLGLPRLQTIESDWTIRGGYDAAKRIPPPPQVTAVVAANDRIALGVMRQLQQRGLRIPQDVSIVGWDDEPMSEFLDPPLTTVHLDRESQGREATRLLINTISGHTSVPETEPVGTLVYRASVGAAPLIRVD